LGAVFLVEVTWDPPGPVADTVELYE